MSHKQLLAFLVLSSLLTNFCGAGITVIGPLPYRSLDDNPFDLSGLNSSFFLEDFEDGAVNLPGLGFGGWEVAGPGSLTDSVDGDDGAIDGSGNGGHSLKVSNPLVFPTSPAQFAGHLRLSAPLIFGQRLINAFGFVWTDALPQSFIGVDIFGASGNEGFQINGNFDDSNNGGTAEDVFIGFISDEPFFEIDLGCIVFSSNPNETNFCEFDHLQVGIQSVPEPDLTLASFLGFVLLFRRRLKWLRD